jgi:hypothetical protein
MLAPILTGRFCFFDGGEPRSLERNGVPTYILPFEEVNNDALVSRINSHKDLDAELDRLCGLGVDGGRSTAGVSAKGNRPQFTLVKPADQDTRTDSPNDAPSDWPEF